MRVILACLIVLALGDIVPIPNPIPIPPDEINVRV